MANLCVLENVTVSFGGVKAVDNVSITIDDDASKITGIIGPNGAGKSTALSVIAGARKASLGEVEVMSKKLRGNANPGKVARSGVARTFQIPKPFTDMTVRENVMVALISSSLKMPNSYLGEADEILNRLGLWALADSKAGSLPLAARKKLELARAIAIKPKLLLLDEVFEGLSEAEIQEMVAICKGLSKDGIRLVLVEHVLRALRQLATELIVLEKGQIIAQGEVEEVLGSDRVKAAYLGFGSH